MYCDKVILHIDFWQVFTSILNYALHCIVFLGLELGLGEMSVNLKDNVLAENILFLYSYIKFFFHSLCKNLVIRLISFELLKELVLKNDFAC